MSTKMFAWAVPASTRPELILDGVIQFLQRADLMMRDVRNVYVSIEPTDAHDLRFVHVHCSWSTSDPCRGIPDNLLEVFVETTGVPVTGIWHDDQHGVYLFEVWDRIDTYRTLSIFGDGPYIAAPVGAITAEFVQKRFSHDELRELNARDPDTLNADELRAVEEWENAVTIGFRQVWPSEARRYLGEAWEHAATYQVVRSSYLVNPIRAAPSYGEQTEPLLSWQVPDDTWGTYDRWGEAGLPPRY